MQTGGHHASRMRMKAFVDFRTPAAGFDQPIEMWLACHERILRMIALIVRLCEHLAAGGSIEAAGVTATSILRYFDEAAPRHHEDEELTLFPRLLAHLQGADRQKIERTIDDLRYDHGRLERSWTALRPALVAITSGTTVSLDTEATVGFVTDYREHVERENDVLASAFRRAFDAVELEAIGRAMAARRGLDWDELFALK